MQSLVTLQNADTLIIKLGKYSRIVVISTHQQSKTTIFSTFHKFHNDHEDS